MTDRELLELAAKAAGMNAHEAMWHPRAGFVWVKRVDGIRTENGWNPLTDDGDALRLAVKLRLTIRHDDPSSAIAGIYALQSGAPTNDGQGPWFVKEWNEGDPYAATRRAIVRAAAEIGRAMP